MFQVGLLKNNLCLFRIVCLVRISQISPIKIYQKSKIFKYVLKRVSFGSKDCIKKLKLSVHISWARLASFCHLGVISDPLKVLKFYNEIHDTKGQENKIYTIVKGRETFYRRHRVPVTSCSEVKYVLKRVSFGSMEAKTAPKN